MKTNRERALIRIAAALGQQLVYHDSDEDLAACLKARGRKPGMFDDCHQSDGRIEVVRDSRNEPWNDFHEMGHLVSAKLDPYTTVDWEPDPQRTEPDSLDVDGIEYRACISECLLMLFLNIPHADIRKNMGGNRETNLSFIVEDKEYVWPVESLTHPLHMPRKLGRSFLMFMHGLIPEEQEMCCGVMDALLRAGIEKVPRSAPLRRGLAHFKTHQEFLQEPWTNYGRRTCPTGATTSSASKVKRPKSTDWSSA